MISQFDWSLPHSGIIGPTGDVKTRDRSHTAIKSLPITVLVKDLQLLNCYIMLHCVGPQRSSRPLQWRVCLMLTRVLERLRRLIFMTSQHSDCIHDFIAHTHVKFSLSCSSISIYIYWLYINRIILSSYGNTQSHSQILSTAHRASGNDTKQHHNSVRN